MLIASLAIREQRLQTETRSGTNGYGTIRQQQPAAQEPRKLGRGCHRKVCLLSRMHEDK